VELGRNSRPSQHVDPHPDPGGARQRQVSGDICLPRPDPTHPKPGNTSHMPPHGGANTFLPDPTLWGPIRRSPDPTPSETPLHNAVDSRPNVTARPGHTTKKNTTKQPQLGDPNPEVGYPLLRSLLHNVRGARGNRHSTRGGHGHHESRLTCHI
jgi:hypothetical protein